MNLFILFFFLLYPHFLMARDFVGSIEEASASLKDIIGVVGILALMIAGASFYWSKRIGMERLGSALVGTIVFASATTLFSLIYRIFN